MGEYALYNGSQVKIGTCENMYYLRAEQRELVTPEANSLDPADESIIGELRFRFPFPEEDDVPPGGFEDAFKTFGVYGLDELLGDVEHGHRQFTAPGFNACLPCPESKEAAALPFKIHRNGYSGSVQIVQQKRIGDEWWTVCQCGGCDAKFRLPLEDAEKLALALRAQADQCRETKSSRREYLHTIAARVLAGYRSEKPSTLAVATSG